MVTIENIFLKYIKLRSKLDNAKIYKITDNTNQNKYIGSTCKTLNQRLSKHKSNYKRFLKGIYNNVKSFDILKNNDFKIELLEKCNIKTKQELLARERFYIVNNNCLNKNIPGNYDKGCQQYHKEYYNDNKEKLNNCHKEYNANNKDKLQQKFICQCGGNYTYAHKSTHLKSNKHQNYLKSQNK
jgi:hypothetical protein